jgi:hypothetical protein
MSRGGEKPRGQPEIAQKTVESAASQQSGRASLNCTEIRDIIIAESFLLRLLRAISVIEHHFVDGYLFLSRMQKHDNSSYACRD